MKSSSQKTVNLLRLALVFMVLGTGQNQAFAASVNQAKAQLHVPWTLLSERLSSVVNRRDASGAAQATPIEARLISVPYDAESINWNLTGGSVTSKVHVDSAQVRADAATVAVSKSAIHVVLDALKIDQVIEKTIGGVIVRVHLTADCGPIVLDQTDASANAVFKIAWSQGTPSAALSALDLRWAPGSWSFNAFTCTGPSGTDQLVQDGLAQFLKDPTALKPYIEAYLSSNLQSSIDESLARLREPFAVGTGSTALTLSVGSLAPASTGVVADLTLRSNAKDAPLSALPIPGTSVLRALSTTEPSLVGDKSVLEFIVAQQLASQPRNFRVDLQSLPAFHKLMKNRLQQLFVWQDLWHFSSDSPFYLDLANPRSLTLNRVAGQSRTLSSRIPLSSTIQAYREKQWWDYVETRGSADASVVISVAKGTLLYQTTLNAIDVKSEYGDEYRQRFHKTSDPLKDSVIAKAIVGPQPALSGSMKWPDIDLAEAGRYRASSFQWASGDTFSLNFSLVNTPR